jgi:collagen type III alpha
MSGRRTTFIAAVLLAVGAVAFSSPAFAGHNGSDDDGPSDASNYGRCTAWENNENGRENGDAENSSAFQDLQNDSEEENQTVSEYCDDVEHPSENHPPENASDGNSSAPDDAGPPEDAGPPDDAGPPSDAGPPEDAGPPSDAGPPDDAGPPGHAGPPDDPGPPDDRGGGR